MKKIFLSLLAAILYICSVGSVFGQVTISGTLYYKKVTTPYNGKLEGTAWLMQDNTIKYTSPVSIVSGKSVFSFTNVADGTYELMAECTSTDTPDAYGMYDDANPITVNGTDQTTINKRMKATGSNSTITFKGFSVNPDSDNPGDIVDEGIVSGATVTITENGKEPVVKTTDENGTIKSLMFNNITYTYQVKAQGYVDTTFEFSNGGIASTYTWYIRKTPVYEGEYVKVSGTVTLNGQTITTLPEGLNLRITPSATGTPLKTDVAEGKYEFAEVPRGTATLHVNEEAAVQNGQIAYEYRIKKPTEAIELGEHAEETIDIDIERFASAVKGDITGFPEAGVFSGYIYLVAPKTAVAEGEPAFDTVQTFSFTCPDQATAANYSFRGVLPGNYTLQVFCYQAYVLSGEITPLNVTLEQDVTVPEIKMVPAETVVRFSPAAGSLNGIYNKYLGETVSLLNGAKLELWNKEKTERLDTAITNTDGVYLKTVCSLGDEFVVTISREDIYPAETTVTVTSMSLYNNFSFEGKIRFVPVAHAALELKAVWNDATKATLTWEWPEAEKMEDLVIAKIELRRRVKTSNEWTVVKTWETPAMDALPTTFNDTEVAKGNQYVYECKITYSTPEDVKTTTCEMDARFRYKLEFSVNDEKMGTITGGQPGNYLENTQIELTALPNPNYEFVAWKSGDDTVAKTATILFNISQDTNLVAIFKNKSFKITVLSDNSEWGTVEGEGTFEFGTEVTVTATPAKGCKFVAWKENTVEVSKEAVYKFTVEKDRTLIAVFEEEVANEDLEASRWTIFAENGTLVINGLDGDRYTVYDLNGRLAGQALCTGTEIRMTVNPNQLYIVRRVSAQGAFGFKKIVVR